MSAAALRLERLLALVPYLLAHPGVSVATAAREFDLTQASLLDDLQLLFVCGLPGHMPDDLIEVSVDDGHIYLSNADTIARPLRLRPDEALALLMGLRVLTSSAGQRGLAGGGGGQVAQQLLGKLSQAAGLNAPGSPGEQVLAVAPDNQSPQLETINQALKQQRQLCIEYHSPRRDSISVRHIDPLTVEAAHGHYYVQAWCHEADELRVFRTDRMVRCTLSDRARRVPEQAHPGRLPRTVFASRDDDHEVVLRISERARWMLDYYDAQLLETLAHGGQLIRLRTPDTDWLVRLALRLGPDAVIVEPPQLAEQVRVAAQQALALHAEATSRHH